MAHVHSDENPPIEKIHVKHHQWRDDVDLFADGTFSRVTVSDGGTWSRSEAILHLSWHRWPEESAIPDQSDIGTPTDRAVYRCFNTQVTTVIVELFAGLGNQMFQFAHGLALARRLGAELKVSHTGSPSEFKLGTFGISLNAELPSHCTLIEDYGSVSIDEEWPSFLQVTSTPTGSAIRLRGYFQGEHYFSPVERELRSIFRSPLPYSTASSRARICIHVRRGDFVGDPKHDLCRPEYYRLAMKLMGSIVKDPQFIIISDDPPWFGASVLRAPNIVVMDKCSDGQALAEMASCDGFILSNSTFGWWGAWLANRGPVIAPRRFISTARWEIQPPSWILLPSEGTIPGNERQTAEG